MNICYQLVKILAFVFQVSTDIQMDVASGSMITITVKQSMLSLLLHAQLKMFVDVNLVLLDTLVSLFRIAVAKSSCFYTFFCVMQSHRFGVRVKGHGHELLEKLQAI